MGLGITQRNVCYCDITVTDAEMLFVSKLMIICGHLLKPTDSVYLSNTLNLHPLTPHIISCRMTNYEMLRWLVETPSRDVGHYRMINASRSTVCHIMIKDHMTVYRNVTTLSPQTSWQQWSGHTMNACTTGWLKIKYPTGEYAIPPQPVVWF